MSGGMCGLVLVLVVYGVIDVWSNFLFFFFKQKTAYEMRISDWSSDVCSSDLAVLGRGGLVVIDTRASHRLADALRAEIAELSHLPKIGRASCRERVCQYV